MSWESREPHFLDHNRIGSDTPYCHTDAGKHIWPKFCVLNHPFGDSYYLYIARWKGENVTILFQSTTKNN